MKLSASTPESVNPYAAPQIDGGYSPTNAGLEGLWRDGDVLVMHKDAPLPPICVKSGQPATEWLQRDLQWHPRWVTWTIFVALPVYVILALILTHKGTIIIGLSREWGNRRRIRMLITGGIVAAGCAVAMAGYILAISEMDGEPWFLLVPVGIAAGFIGSTAYGQYACRLVWPKQISRQFIWLRGVHPDFLKLLPQWPGDGA